MKLLLLADRPPSQPIREIFSKHPDISLVVTLGDLTYMDLNALSIFPHVPKIGVYGNHCDGMYMDNLGITNIHLKTFELDGVIFGGFEGCVQYKHGKFQYTQEDAMEMMKSFPKVDVLVCHCPPFGVNDDQSDNAHVGFHATREYIDCFRPKYVFHGHTYDTGDFVDTHGDTKVIYAYRDRIIEI